MIILAKAVIESNHEKERKVWTFYGANARDKAYSFLTSHCVPGQRCYIEIVERVQYQ